MAHPAIDQQITFLSTRDLARVARFYEEVMSLPLKLDQGTCRIDRNGWDAYLGFCQSDDAQPGPDQGLP